jgi:Domain of unknown function (DUF4333)
VTGPPRQGPGHPWWIRPGGAPWQGRPASPPPPKPPVTPLPTRRHAAPPSPESARTKRSRHRSLIWAGFAIVAFEVVVLVAALWFFGHFDGDEVLDVREAEAGVRRILRDPIYGYGANNVTSVTCNNGRNPVIEQGRGFTCQVYVDGARRQVEVVFRDNAGTYEVDGPR